VLLAALPTSRCCCSPASSCSWSGLAVAVVLPGQRPPAASSARRGAGRPRQRLAGRQRRPCQVETRYYCAQVVADPQRESGRTLVLDGLSHSYVDLDDPTHLEFAYTQRFGDVLAVQPDGPLDALHLGLGGGTLPRHLAAVRPGSRSTVLEVDPQVVQLDRDRLGLRTGPDLEVQVGDARTGVVEQPDDAYDVVVGDAFGSLAVPWHLTTRELVEQVRRVLRPDGTYLLNVIDNPPLAFARAEAATLRAVFAHVAVYATPGALGGTDGGNLVLVASDRPLPLDRLRALAATRGERLGDAAAFAGDAQVLTDDDAPVDQLLTPYRRAPSA
jgi:spermidine synthase